MVIIENFFIHYQRPAQYVVAGEKYLDIYKYVNKSFQKTRTVEDISIFDLDPGTFGSAAGELAVSGSGGNGTDTGIILNSSSYIFNIFDFEKIPLRRETQREVVEWRLRKVFPENIEEYDHHFFTLGKNRILSILFKKSLKEKIEGLFAHNHINLIYMGNSTVNCLNNVLGLKSPPDFFIEIDRNLIIAAFQDRTLPFYIRKFRAENESEVVAELAKTINYVKNSYSQTPRTYSVISNRCELNLDVLKYELKEQEVRPLELKNKEHLFLPG
jgi:hypothetical protein